MKDDLRRELLRAFNEFCAIPFPVQSSHDRVWEVHADLAALDSYIAGSVSTRLGGGSLSRPIQLDAELEIHLESMALERGADAEDAKTYLDYFRRLKELAQLAERYRS